MKDQNQVSIGRGAVPDRRTRCRRRLACGSAALAAATSVALVPSTAEAWTWSGAVTVNGFAHCGTGTPAVVPARAIWMQLGNGEIEQASVNAIGYFENALHTVPPGGSVARVYVYCSVPGNVSGWRYAGTTAVTRPWVGSYPASFRIFTA